MDTGGAEYQALTDCYIKTAEGFMILYSINSRNSFEYTSKIRKRVLEIRGASKRLAPPILLVATKADLVQDRVVSVEEGQNLANSWNNGNLYDLFLTA
jgi:GTPase SAR1 family protein